MVDEGPRRYDAPEPREETKSRGVVVGVLGALVVLLMILIATGKVQIFNI